MSGFVADTTSYRPWQNAMSFNPTFSADSLSSFTPGVYGWGTTTGSSSNSSDSCETLEEFQRKEAKKNKEELQEITQNLAKQKEIEAQKKDLVDEAEALKKGKQADGSANIVKDFKKLTVLDKVKIGGMNILKGIGNVCKSIVGIEADGSFNLKKCIRNVAITVGTAVLCVFAAPAVAAIATAVGASAATAAACATVASGAVTALTYAGLAAGVVKTGQGIYDACQADTTEEFDKATQEAGQGLFIALASRAGLKGSAKAAGVLSKAPAGSSVFAKLGVGAKNILVNPWKAARVQGVAAGNGAQSAVAPTGATNIFGKISQWTSRKTGWYRFKSARQAVKNVPVANSRKEYTTALDNTKASIEARITKIEAELQATTSNSKKAALSQESNKLYEILDKLDKVKTHSDWRSLRKLAAQSAKETGKMRGKWYTRPFTADKKISINSQEFRRADLLDDLAKMQAEQKVVAAEIQQLTKLRMESMSQMAKMSSSARLSHQVSEFGFSSKWYAKPLNWVKTKRDCGMSTFEKVMGGMNVGFFAMEPWWALQPIVRQTYMMPVNGLTMFYDPVVDKPEGEYKTAEEVAKLEAEYILQYKELKKQEKDIQAKLT